MEATVHAIEQHQGNRDHMEDTYSVTENDHWWCIGVFDGHGGHQVSAQLAHGTKGLGAYLLEHLPPPALLAAPPPPLQKRSSKKGHARDVSTCADPDSDSEEDSGEEEPEGDVSMCTRLKSLFKDYDTLLRHTIPEENIGSTACICLIPKHPSSSPSPPPTGSKKSRTKEGEGEPSRLMWVANLGDSRAVVVEADTFRLRFMTLDHKPNVKSEKKRIERAGGQITHSRGDVARINRLTAISRSFGDFHLKRDEEGKRSRDYVSARPDVSAVRVTGPLVVVLGTDGIWDEVSLTRLVAAMRAHPKSFAKNLTKWILAQSSQSDNLTCLSFSIT